MKKDIVDMENLQDNFYKIMHSKEWEILEKDFISSNHVFIIGNGGNMSIADHAAVDISRLTDKNAICPGSGVVATSLISDNSFEVWFTEWVQQRLRFIDQSTVLILGISCSTTGASSSSLIGAMDSASQLGIKCHMICAKEKKQKHPGINFINQDVKYYHTSEVISTMMFYQLIHAAGFECPSIEGKAKARAEEVKKMEVR